MDQGGDTYQEGTRQVDEQRRGVLSTLPYLRQPVRPEFHYLMSSSGMFGYGPAHLTKECAKTIFFIFVPSDLDICPLDFKFVPLVTLVQRYVSAELEVSTGFSIWRKLEAYDGVQQLMRPLREDLLISVNIHTSGVLLDPFQ